MIKAYSLYTSEVDNIEVATKELKSQMSDISLCSNSVGIIACHYDYISTGMINVLQEILPFPVIGFTTFFQKTNKTQGLFEMTITVLTSDDVNFSLVHSSSETDDDNPEDSIRTAYLDALDKSGSEPVCIFSFLSVNRPISGDEYIRIMDSISGGVPCFGGITTGDSDMGQNMFIISDGEVFSYGFAMLLISGNVELKYHYVNYDETTFIDMPGTITKVSGQNIIEINNRPVSDFLDRRGIDVGPENMAGLLTIPFLFKRNSNSPHIARIAYNIDGEGSLQLFGEAPEGAKFRVGTSEPSEIIYNAERLLKTAVSEDPDAGVFFMFSCIGRYIALGMREGTEFENFNKILPGNIPYLAAYVGGELCPIMDENRMINEFHNSSLIICSLS